jgi:hypothetical protein
MSDLSFLMILTMISINAPPMPKMIQSTLLSFIYFDALMTDMWVTPSVYSKEQ